MTIETEIRAFRESVAAVLRTGSESTAALNSIAGALSNSSGLTSDRAASAVQTTNEASANMIAAAGATEELIALIGEIGRQISWAAEVASHSVSEAQTTNERGRQIFLRSMPRLKPRARARPAAASPWSHPKSNR